MSIHKTPLNYVANSVESILHQTFDKFEFIIVNNGGDKQVSQLLNSYNDARLSVINLDNVITLYESRAYAINQAKYEWIALMDADDISLPNRLEVQWKFINLNESIKIGAVGTWAKYLNEKDEVLGFRNSSPSTLDEYERMKAENDAIILTDPSALISKRAFLEVGGYRSFYSPAADLDFWYRMVDSGYVVISIPEYLFLYRIHEQASSARKFLLQRKMTHFANLNMKRRRSNLPEIDFDNFQDEYWSKLRYRLPRMWRNYAKYYYKKAGLAYFKSSFLKMVFYMILGAVLNPIYFYQRLSTHLFNKGSL